MMGRDEATYRIVDWDKHYETSETKKIKQLSWVPIKNRQGDGYLDLIEAHGPAGLGWWLALVQDASRASRDKRDGTIFGTIRRISRRTRIPSGNLPDVIRTLVQIGWLQQLTDRPDGISGSSGCLPGDKPLKEGTEQKEEKEGTSAPPPDPSAQALKTLKQDYETATCEAYWCGPKSRASADARMLALIETHGPQTVRGNFDTWLDEARRTGDHSIWKFINRQRPDADAPEVHPSLTDDWDNRFESRENGEDA